jgi:hypothetical protein
MAAGLFGSLHGLPANCKTIHSFNFCF